jgi:hypothetical protein
LLQMFKGRLIQPRRSIPALDEADGESRVAEI